MNKRLIVFILTLICAQAISSGTTFAQSEASTDEEVQSGCTELEVWFGIYAPEDSRHTASDDYIISPEFIAQFTREARLEVRTGWNGENKSSIRPHQKTKLCLYWQVEEEHRKVRVRVVDTSGVKYVHTGYEWPDPASLPDVPPDSPQMARAWRTALNRTTHPVDISRMALYHSCQVFSALCPPDARMDFVRELVQIEWIPVDPDLNTRVTTTTVIFHMEVPEGTAPVDVLQ